jgi:hypothetical protein
MPQSRKDVNAALGSNNPDDACSLLVLLDQASSIRELSLSSSDPEGLLVLAMISIYSTIPYSSTRPLETRPGQPPHERKWAR